MSVAILKLTYNTAISISTESGHQPLLRIKTRLPFVPLLQDKVPTMMCKLCYTAVYKALGPSEAKVSSALESTLGDIH
jgi:hypothetical protein